MTKDNRGPTAVDCPVCGKTISRKADLARHMRVHATNKEQLMHACPHDGCMYKALQRSNLMTHLNVHSGRRPNSCPERECGFATSDPGSLTRHRKEIHGYKPKVSSRDDATPAARKAARQQRRLAPYAIPSSSSGSGHSRLPLNSSTGTDHPPRIELPQLLNVFPLIPPFAEAQKPKEGKRTNLPAYSTELVYKLAEEDSPCTKGTCKPTASRRRTSRSAATVVIPTVQGSPSPHPAASHLAVSQSPTTLATPTLEGPLVPPVGHPAILPPAQPASEGPIFDAVRESMYEGFPSQLGAPTTLGYPLSSYAPSPAFLPSYVSLYSGESFLPPPSPHPASYDYCDARWPLDVPQSAPQCSFDAPDVYHQNVVDQAPFCVAPSATIYAPMQDYHYH